MAALFPAACLFVAFFFAEPSEAVAFFAAFFVVFLEELADADLLPAAFWAVFRVAFFFAAFFAAMSLA